MANPATTWTPVKTYDAATATESAPTAGNLTALPTAQNRGPIHGLVEFRMKAPVFAGTAAATAVTIALYREVGGEVDWLYDWTISAADVTAGTLPPLPPFDVYSNKVSARLKSFTGGTAPSFSGTVQCRELE